MFKQWWANRQRRTIKQKEQKWFIESVQNCVDGLWTYIDGAVFVSPQLSKKLGYELPQPEMIYPEWWFKRIHEKDLPQAKNFFKAYCRSAQNIASQVHFRVQHADGHYLWFMVSCYASKLPSDSSYRLIGTVLDISSYHLRQEHLEAELKDTSEKLQTKSKFVALLNHELRTPISSILGATELLMETQLTQDQKKYLDYLSDAAQYLLELVNDVLDMEKISAGKLKIEPLEFDFQQWVEKVVCLLEPMAKKKQLVFQVKIASDVPKIMMGDSNKLQHILINLINNAIKFTDQGSVTLLIKPIKNKHNKIIQVHFQVDDTGIGIAADQIATLFDDYSQANVSIARTYGGSGLGLAICKNLVELMGGKIGVKSLPNKGSTFWFTIPFIKPQSNHPLSNLPEPLPACMMPLKILLVEDNLINQEVLRGYLSKFGDIIVVANDGIEAVKQFEKGKFDLILMDIYMPGMNGLQAMETIRKSPKGSQIPIIAITANNNTEDWQDYCAKGMTKVLSKPVDREKLETLLAPYREPCFKKAEVPNDLDIKLPLADLTYATLNRLVELYRQDAENILFKMRTASREDLYNLAHTLAGMSENIGFMKVGKTARILMKLTQTEENPQSVIDLLVQQVPQSIHLAKEILQQAEETARE